MGSNRKVVQTELDALGFEQFGEIALKSFRHFNHGWDLVICDTGLTDQQRKLLEQVGTVYPYAPDRCGSNAFARLSGFRKALNDYDLLLHLNPDTATFSHIDAWLDEFNGAEAEVSAPTFSQAVRARMARPSTAAKLLGVDSDSLDQLVYSTGAMLLRSTDKTKCVIDEVVDRYNVLAGSSRGQDNDWLPALFHARGCHFRAARDWYVHIPPFGRRLSKNFVVASELPRMKHGQVILIMSFDYEKYHLTRIDGWDSFGYRLWLSWYEVTKHFRDFPWIT